MHQTFCNGVLIICSKKCGELSKSLLNKKNKYNMYILICKRTKLENNIIY